MDEGGIAVVPSWVLDGAWGVGPCGAWCRKCRWVAGKGVSVRAVDDEWLTGAVPTENVNGTSPQAA